MSTIEELRQQAKAAWQSGSLAATSVAQSALRAALTEAWKRGECCGDCNAQGWCMSVTIGQQRGWRYGHYYVGSEIMWAGTFCEHSEAGKNAIRDYIWSPLLQVQLVKRLLSSAASSTISASMPSSPPDRCSSFSRSLSLSWSM